MVEKREIVTSIHNIKEIRKLLLKIIRNPKIMDVLPDVIYLGPNTPITKVLTDERVRLLKTVKKRPDITVNELARVLRRAPQAISRDLRILAEYNLIDMKKEGRKIRSEVKYSWIVYPVSA
jgi:predicted transcriptional regulator